MSTQEELNNAKQLSNTDHVEDISILLDAQINPHKYDKLKIKVHNYTVDFLKIHKVHQDDHIYKLGQLKESN